MSFVGMAGIGGVRLTQMFQQERIEQLEQRLAASEQELLKANAEKARAMLRATAAEKLLTGSLLTREEVAAHMGASTKKVQRMDAAGILPRCPNMGAVVRYAARDVLRLAPAYRGKES